MIRKEDQKGFDQSLNDSPVVKAINEKLSDLEKNLMANTESTKQIATNTAPLLQLYHDLAAGTMMMCRIAYSVTWVLTTIEKNYKRLIILAVLIFAITHNFHLPEWFTTYLKMLGA